MDSVTREKCISDALKKMQRDGGVILKEKFHKLLVERQIPFIPLTTEIDFLRSLGYGNYGIVELVSYQEQIYAHKRPQQNSREHRNSILDEAIKLTDIDEHHPNIQRLYYISLKSSGFLMDYCNNSSLDKIITDHNFKYTLYDALDWSYQLADALSFLHSKNIMHRDVKMDNILLKNNHQTLVLTDYGTATQCGRSLLTNSVGTPIIMAPEVCSGTQYDEQCDIYSWSIVFWQLLSKQLLPYGNQNMSFLLKVIMEKLRPHKLNNCPEVFVALMYRSWHSDPKERPTLSFIKKVLRIMLNVLLENREDFLVEMMEED